MALIDMYRSNVQRKKQEISKLNQDKAKEQSKIADYSKKNLSAKQSISRSKSQSTINSKIREIERNDKQISDCEKKIASIQSKIAQKEKELNSEEIKVFKEQEKIDKKRTQEENKRMRDSQRRENEINSKLCRHETFHKKVEKEIEEMKKLPQKIIVLFFASNPTDQTQLRLDEEVRSIMDNIRKTDYRDSVEFKSIWATRPLDLLQALNEYRPTIVHFSGHGSQRDEIVFQDSLGNSKFVTKEALIQTMVATSENIRVVFFNTCYSRNQAESVVKHIDAAIGMNGKYRIS